MTRDSLVAEYDRLCRLLDRAGMEPVVSVAVLDAFTDEELAALVKDAAQQLVRIRRYQA